MILNVFIQNNRIPIQVPREIYLDNEASFAHFERNLEKDIDPTYHPLSEAFCQKTAILLYDAIQAKHANDIMRFAGYILSRKPGVIGLHFDAQSSEPRFEFIMGTLQ